MMLTIRIVFSIMLSFFLIVSPKNLAAEKAAIPAESKAHIEVSRLILQYATFFGGKEEDTGMGIAIDAAGNIYLAINTASSKLLTTERAAIRTFRGGESDIYIAKLSADGSSLIYATYLGGKGKDFVTGIAVDAAGHAYVTGWTSSSDFPVRGKVFGKVLRGKTNAFVSKLNVDGSALLYSTYLGGGKEDAGQGIAVDAAGHAYVTGWTSSSDFPVRGKVFGKVLRGKTNAFVSKLNVDGSALLYSTYLGGSQEDSGRGIAVDAAGHAYVTGRTFSKDFPTASSIQPFNAGDSDVFIAKLTPAGSSLVYSTYLGGRSSDLGVGIAIDKAGNAYVTGSTYSTDFPTLYPLQSHNGYAYDAFVAAINPQGAAILFSTYLGGEGYDWGHSIAIDGLGNVYVIGYTNSFLFPTVRPLQASIGGDADSFVVIVKLNSHL